MSEHIDSVNRIARMYRATAQRLDDGRREVHVQEAERLEAVSAELARLYGLTSALPPDLGNIYDLPPELQKELSITKADALDDQLVTVINAYGGVATLDQVLVGLYRKFGMSQKRRFVQNKLYRMTMVWSVPGKKGVYTTKQAAAEPEQGSGATAETDRMPGPSPAPEDDDDIPF